MEISTFFEYLGKAVTVLASALGLIWAFEKWWRREEHFPRINFDIKIDIIDHKDGSHIINVLAILENKGVVPLKIKDFSCEIKGIKENDELKLGDQKIRHQLNFKHSVVDGIFFPKEWESSFVHPGVTTTYNYVTIVPDEYLYLLIKGTFGYLKKSNMHHSGTIIKMPDKQK